LYKKGVFSNLKCGTNLNHGVLAAGVGSEGGKNFYLVKNSWGTAWGDAGYIKILNNGDGPGLCGI
jgi:C1A family cysteine protease